MSASPVTTPGLTVAGSVAVAALREVAGRAAELGLVNALALAQSARIESLTIVLAVYVIQSNPEGTAYSTFETFKLGDPLSWRFLR